MAINHSFNLSVHVEGKNVETVFTETDGSSLGAIQIGGKYYTYQCAAQEDKVRAIIQEALKSNPKTVVTFRANVAQVEKEFAARMEKSFAKGAIESPSDKGPIAMQNTPAAEKLSSWLKAFNSGSYAELEAFQSQYFEPNDYDPKEEQSLYFSTGGLDLIEVEKFSPSGIVCILREKYSDQYMRMTLEVEGNLIKRKQLVFIAPPPGLEVKRMNEGALIEATRVRVTDLTEQRLFSGAVLIAHKDDIIFSFSGGLLPEISSEENPMDIKFNLGSMNKMFTAVGIMQLVQRGALSLDTPIGEVLKKHPDLAHVEIHPDVAKITIKQLLTHTGGAGDIFGAEARAIEEQLQNPKDYITLYNQRGLETPVGEYHYSNYGFVLLGAAIEAISQMDYYDYVHQKIFEPAGMNSTESHWKTEHVPNMAVGYMRDYDKEDPELERNDQFLPIRGTPAGGGYSTPNDMLRFANALKKPKQLLDDPKLLTADPVNTPWQDRYGYGFAIPPVTENPWFGHTGGAEGVNCSFKIYPNSNHTVIVMSNLDRPAAERVADFINERLPTV